MATARFAGLHYGPVCFDFMFSSYFYSQKSVKLLLLSLSFLNFVHFVSSFLFFQKFLSNFFLVFFCFSFHQCFFLFSPFHFLKYLLYVFHIQTQVLSEYCITVLRKVETLCCRVHFLIWERYSAYKSIDKSVVSLVMRRKYAIGENRERPVVYER